MCSYLAANKKYLFGTNGIDIESFFHFVRWGTERGWIDQRAEVQ